MRSQNILQQDFMVFWYGFTPFVLIVVYLLEGVNGGCRLQDLSISQVIDHVTCYNSTALIG